MIVSDLASLLVYIASGAASAGVSRLLEQFEWFHALEANGKIATVVGASALLAIVAVFAQSVVAQHPFINDSVDPYVKALLPLVNMFFSQLSHGTKQAGIRRAELAAWEAKKAEIFESTYAVDGK